MHEISHLLGNHSFSCPTVTGYYRSTRVHIEVQLHVYRPAQRWKLMNVLSSIFSFFHRYTAS